MLTPAEAHKRMTERGLTGMDDGTEPSYPWRWYYNEQGRLCLAAWRCEPTAYPEFTRGKIPAPATSRLTPKEETSC